MRNAFNITRREFLTALPLASSRALSLVSPYPTRALDANRPVVPNPGRRIYAVDDWPCLTELYCRILEPAGYEVRAFNNRAQALKEILTIQTKPLLLITDFDGYPISAELLMHYCRVAQPSLKILMVTGYDETCLNRLHVKPDQFLQKPFSPNQLVACVQRTLKPRSRSDSIGD